MELILHKIDILQTGATSQGSLKVRSLALYDTDHRRVITGFRLRPCVAADPAARTEQTAEISSWRLGRRGTMCVRQERRCCGSVQDTPHRAASVSCDFGQGPAFTT